MWGQFLAGFVFRTQGETEGKRQDDDVVRIERLETVEFEPSMEYITQSVAGHSVRNHVGEREGKAALYMVTGMKVVKGASIGRVEDGMVQWTELMDFVLAIRVCKVYVDESNVDTRHAHAMDGEGRRDVKLDGDLTIKDMEMMLGEEYSIIGDAKETSGGLCKQAGSCKRAVLSLLGC